MFIIIAYISHFDELKEIFDMHGMIEYNRKGNVKNTGSRTANKMKKAIMYGGGNIGRGFIGKVFSDSGYEVCFLDIMQDLIDEMNARHGYTVRIVSNAGEQNCEVKNVRAVNAATSEALEEIATCDIMATAVGVNVLPKIAPTIAKGVVARMEGSGKPLDIILCENQLEADVLMRGWINDCLAPQQRAWADKNLGLVEASIGRMVPPLTPEMRAKDRLLICVEPYAQLPVDRKAFRGEIPDLVGLVPYSPFGFYIRRKLFIHNMGHAICAYLGYMKGYSYIYEAMADAEIQQAVRLAMKACGEALIHEYGEDLRQNVEENIEDLIFRFQNRALGDTVSRVGGDPARKLRRNDRLVGAALYCMENDVDATPVVKGIWAALRFDAENDASAAKVQADLKNQGLDFVIKQYMGLDAQEPLFDLIKTICQA